MKGWIKLHRKILESEIWHDQTALRVFIWLLLTVNHKTGKLKLGRKWASDACDLKEMTFYKALKRLEKKFKIVNLVTSKMTIKYTEATVQNWQKYQSGNNLGNNQVTIKEQSSNNQVTHNKNKERRKKKEEVTTKVVAKKTYGNQQVNLLLEEFEKRWGFPPTDRQPRRQAWNLVQRTETFIKRYGKTPDEDIFKRVIVKLFNWIEDQDWSENIQKIETVKLKSVIFFSAHLKKREGVKNE